MLRQFRKGFSIGFAEGAAVYLRPLVVIGASFLALIVPRSILRKKVKVRRPRSR